ncbi:MAG TPA: PDZ domain-containing protein [Spirochaetia bacterium]|nr:PDZ domain-containing protein [Spirochaetia bacterium]
MAQTASMGRRALAAAAFLLAMTAALGFAQSAPGSPSNQGSGRPSEPGVLVVSVQPGSPAEKAGIVRGDIILNVNGTAVNTLRDVRQTIAKQSPGDTVTLKVRHGDNEKTESVVLAGEKGHPTIGVALLPDLRDARDQARESMRGFFGDTNGAVVMRVTTGGPADKAGLKRGDLILSVDGTAVDPDHSLSALIAGKKAGDKVTLSVAQRRAEAGSPHDVTVTLGTSPDGKKAWLGVSYATGNPLAEYLLPDDDFPGPGMMTPHMTPRFADPPSI